MVGGIM